VVPDRYEMNAGKIGRIHGEKKDPAPARAEINMPVSTMQIVTLF
jgi:hypothetical protein